MYIKLSQNSTFIIKSYTHLDKTNNIHLITNYLLYILNFDFKILSITHSFYWLIFTSILLLTIN